MYTLSLKCTRGSGEKSGPKRNFTEELGPSQLDLLALRILMPSGFRPTEINVVSSNNGVKRYSFGPLFVIICDVQGGPYITASLYCIC